MYPFDEIINRWGTDSIKWNTFGDAQPFWIADTDFAVLPEILDAMKARCGHPIFGYADAPASCLSAIQGWFARRYGWTPDTGSMVMAGGIVTAIYFTLQALTAPGDRILTMSPVYNCFFAAIENSGRAVADCPLLPRGDSFEMDFDAIEKQLKGGVKAVLFCNPQNPVGRCWTREELGRLCSLCAEYGVYLLSDEIHCDITLFGHRYTPMALFPEVQDRLVVYTAISKTFNMAGLASSCLMIPNADTREKVAGALHGAWLHGPASIAFPAIEAAYTDGDAWVNEQNAYLEGNVRFVQEYCAKNLPEVGLTRQEATYLMWLDFGFLGLPSAELTTLLREEYRIALSCGSDYIYGDASSGCMRLNIGCPRATLAEGMEKILAFCNNRRGNL